MSNSIFMLSKHLKKTVTTALILGLMISPILPAAQSISSSISIAAQATEVDNQAEKIQTQEAQATNGEWSEYADTAWYDESKNEYSIATAEELAGLAYLVNTGIDGVPVDFEGKTIKLTADINLGEHEWVPIGLGTVTSLIKETTYEFIWESQEAVPRTRCHSVLLDVFKGTFDGQSYVIENMLIGESKDNPKNYKYAGLFGRIKGATITNVNINSGRIYASSDSVGGIVGYAEESTLNYSNNNAEVLLAKKRFKSVYCTYVGGIAGLINDATQVNFCNNYGNVNSIADSRSNVGGICGLSSGGVTRCSVINCNNYADISSMNGTAVKVGGICGESRYSNIVNCMNNGSILTESNKRAFSGGILGNPMMPTEIINCINCGKVSAKSKQQAISGGITSQIMSNNTNIDNCINIGEVTTDSESEETSYSGEICGQTRNYHYQGPSINNSYYKAGTSKTGIGKKDTQINPEDQPGKITALPESQMTAAEGTIDGENWVDITINVDGQGKIALVDALNYGVDALNYGVIENYELLSSPWIQNNDVNDGYPTIVTNNNNAANDGVVVEDNAD